MTQPCQIQYIEYFRKYLLNPNVYPQVMSIKKLTFRGGFTFSSPYVKLINIGTGKVVYNTHDLEASLVIEKHN